MRYSPQPTDHLQGIIVPPGRRVHGFMLMLLGCSLVIGLGSPECLIHTLEFPSPHPQVNLAFLPSRFVHLFVISSPLFVCCHTRRVMTW